MNCGLETFRFHEFDIPVPLLNMTGGGTDTFDIMSRAHIDNLRRHIRIDPDNSFMEIGCGIGRDAIPLYKILSSKGKYIGLDIIKPSIDFCADNIVPRYPNFRFVHFDIKDQLHNPSGIGDMTDHVLPVEESWIDKVIAWSVLPTCGRKTLGTT